jgi:pimeloyl-ACP methyl ester carboxylesterase
VEVGGMKLDVNGHAAFIYTGGKPFDPALPCVVFVHGALHDHSAWTLLARWFAHHGHAVLAVDLPGHTQSEGPPLVSVESTADWLWALLDRAGVQRAAFVGHSMGSLIAMEAAARRPAAATALAMIGTAYPMKVSEALLGTARETPLKAIDMVNAFSISSTASKPSYPGPGMWVHGSNRALMRRTQATALQRLGINLFVHDFQVCDRYANGLQAAAQVTCPVTFILGDRDQMTSPKTTREIAAALRAQVATLPAGHSLMAEAPDAVLNALRSALPRSTG